MKVGFLGTGAIAAPMVRFLVDRGHEVCVSERGRGYSSALAASHGVAVKDNQGVVDASDVIFLCLRPQHAREAIAPLTFRDGQRIVSAMAGVTDAQLSTWCAPVTDFVRTIPFEYIEHGGCPLPALGNDALLRDLFEPENPVIKVGSEDALNAHFAACTILPGVLDLMATGADWLAARTGDAQGSEIYLKSLISGYIGARQGSLAKERDALATEGTLSLQMTTKLQSGGAHAALKDGLNAIEERLKA